MRPSTLLIGAGVWLVVGAVVATTSDFPLPVAKPAEPVTVNAAAGEKVPIRLVIANLQIDARVEPVGTGDGGALNLPQNAAHVGWWIGGATPADPGGTVIIAGHVDVRSGPGALFALRDVRAGELIEVTDAHASTAYVVESVAIVRKPQLPRALFTTRGPRQLALISCGGPFNHSTGHYRDNIVVLARPA